MCENICISSLVFFFSGSEGIGSMEKQQHILRTSKTNEQNTSFPLILQRSSSTYLRQSVNTRLQSTHTLKSKSKAEQSGVTLFYHC